MAGGSHSANSLAGFAVDDPYRITNAFLKDHSRLFGYGPSALDQARISREDHDPQWADHGGPDTAGGIAVFEGVLISHDGRVVG